MNTRSTRRSLLVAVVVLFSSACSATKTAGYLGQSQFTKGRNGIIGFDANRRAAFLTFDEYGRIIGSCSEPPPDAVTTLATELSVKATGKGNAGDEVNAEGSLEATNKTTQAVTELAKKTAETLFLREILFRRCEERMGRRALAVAALEAENSTDRANVLKYGKSYFDDVDGNNADDRFFRDVMHTYRAISAVQAGQAHLNLIHDALLSLKTAEQTDERLLKAVGLAVADPNKLSGVYKRIEELISARPKVPAVPPIEVELH